MIIKKCPWCGHSAIVQHKPFNSEFNLYWVECTKCNATAPEQIVIDDISQSEREAQIEAIKFWNDKILLY